MNDSTPNNIQPINAYFSHSYRADDRDVNLAFWGLFSQEGFYFTIDPQSNAFIIPHIERLMRFSDCFIAVVTHRTVEITKAGKTRKHNIFSPYIAFENFIAELAEKPRLVFVEDDLELSAFGNDDCVHPFNRITLRTKVNQYRDIVHTFAKRVRSYASYYEQDTVSFPTKKAGILLRESQDATGYSRDLINEVKEILRFGGGFTPEDLQPHMNNGLKEFIRKLSELELVVMDVLDPAITSDILAIVQAKAIPCIRIARLTTNNAIDILRSQGLLKDYFVGEDVPAILWDDGEKLKLELDKYMEKFVQARAALDTFEQGRKYFISAGRKKHKVFISNAGSLNPLALELVKELQTLNIQFFQYMSNSSIEIGTIWEQELKKELSEFNVFVALINDDYHNSRYCQQELEIAVKRYQSDGVTILAYLCEETQFPKAIQDLLQGKDIHVYSDSEMVKIISEQIDKELLKKNEVKKEKTDMPGNQTEDAKKISVFLNHASEDKPLVRELYQSLKNIPWLDPWLDEEKLLPGQDWDYEIEKAIKNADAVIICISETSSTKIGVVQAEIRKAQEMQERRPQGYIYMIPVLLGKCKVPDNLREYHWVDITVKENIDKIVKSLETIKSFKR